MSPLSLRCPVRLSPHSEVGGEQPHGRRGLQFPHLSQPRPASPQGPRRPPEGIRAPRRSRARRTPAEPPGPRGEGVRARPPPTGLPGRGRTWTGAAVAAGDATALTLHEPLPASVSLPGTGVRPDLGRPRLPSSRPPGPTCAVARTVNRSALGTPALHRGAGCAPDSGDGGRGGGGKRAGGRAEGWLLPPAQDRRFLSSLGPLHARAAPRGSQTAARRKFCFSLGGNQRGGSVTGSVARDRKTGRFPGPGSERQGAQERDFFPTKSGDAGRKVTDDRLRGGSSC